MADKPVVGRVLVPLDQRDPNAIYCDEPGRTQQNAKDECDINVIMASVLRGADISQLRRGAPMYGDFTNLPDYRSAMVMVTKAREMFMSLDANVRERFANDPGRLLDFLANDKNRDEAVKLGLVNEALPVDAPATLVAGAAGVSTPAGVKP